MTQTPSGQLPRSKSGGSAMDVATEAARQAGKILRDRLPTSKEIGFKGQKDIVTDVDLAAEHAALGILRQEYPHFGILSEESEPVASSSQYTWVVDPLDGTRNYASGIGHFCTVVALSDGNDPVLGVTYDPLREELYSAELGMGAFLNGKPLAVSENRNLSQSLLCCDMGYVDEKAGQAIELIRFLWPGMLSIRLMGSSALGVAYAAAGRVDLYFHHSLSPWDIAAGLVLVREAGGIVVDKRGQPADLRTSSVIASSPQLVQRFLEATEGLAWRK